MYPTYATGLTLNCMGNAILRHRRGERMLREEKDGGWKYNRKKRTSRGIRLGAFKEPDQGASKK
jgi:hypothetical protein